MSAPPIFRRQRSLSSIYHVGVYDYKLVRSYDEDEPIQFQSVALAPDSRIMFPGPQEALHHWCGVNSWDFEVSFTPTSLSSNYPTLSSWTKRVG